MSFRAIVLEKEPGFSARVAQIDREMLEREAGGGDVLLRLSHSTINYKDGLAITNRSPVVRKWPMVPGIDGAGVIAESESREFPAGTAVLLNGFGVGETHWGCLAEFARVQSAWLIRLPEGLDAPSAMAIGTAGYTAMLCVQVLEDRGALPAAGEVLVTGAAGGVGSIAVSLLAARGYQVTASTGRMDEESYLRMLGAAQVIDRANLSAPGKPLQKERWSAVVDTVGSTTLANAIAQCRYGATVAACGLAGGMDLPTTVAPFILRNVRLEGVDSVMASLDRRKRAWSALALELRRDHLEAITTTIGLEECLAEAPRILAGQVRGRLVVDLHR